MDAATPPPTVSVLLPVYNGEAFLRETVSAIQAQTFADWELVIVDDASRDGSFALARTLAETDPRIRCFHNERNLGLAGTMNRLFELARGRYCAVQEQDDLSLPGRLAAEVRLLDERPEVGYVSGLAEWVDDGMRRITLFPGLLQQGRQYPQEPHDMVRFLYVHQMRLVNAGAMFRREAAAAIPGPFDREARMAIDLQFAIRVAHRWRIWGLHEIVVRMRRGAAHHHLSGDKSLQFREVRRMLRLLLEEFGPRPDSPIDARLYRKALAAEMVLEGRYLSGFRGVRLLLQAIRTDPGNGAAWRSLGQFGARRIQRAVRNSTMRR